MGKAVTGLLIVVGIWVGVEFFTEGPSQAFGGALAGFLGDDTAETSERSTGRRAGDSVARAHAEADARRERMLRE